MIIKILLTLITFTVFWLSFIANSYNSELVFIDEWKTIKELKENINSLDKINSDLESDFSLLNSEYDLKKFLKIDLNEFELLKIRNIIYEYNKNRVELENKLEINAKKLLPTIDDKILLLEEKKLFFSKLTPYIDTKFSDEYLEYIKWDAKIFSEQKNIASNLISKKEILSIKVTNIETKIQEHKDFIDNNIRKIIEKKLDEKIENLSKNETFKILNKDSKKKVIEKTIVKVKIKLQNLENNYQLTNSWLLLKQKDELLNSKIQTYNITVEKLENFRNSIK